MSPKTLIYISAFVGSVIGSFVPALWGGSLFSISSVLFSGIGALIAIFIAFKILHP